MSEFQPTDLSNVQLNEHIIWTISQCLKGNDWQKVGRQLHISAANLEEICFKYRDDYGECSYRMLALWHETDPKGTLQNLFSVLETLELHRTVHDITQRLGKEVKPVPQSTILQNGDLAKTQGKITIYDDQIVGRGGHSTIVYKGRYEGREAAIKKVPREFVSLVETEIKTLIQADGHPNIIRYFGREQDTRHFYVALELCQCNLVTFCHSDYKSIRDQKDDRRLLREITEGLAYLHAAGTIHRDIKPENILISQPNMLGHIKAVISDFGYSKKLPPGKASVTQSAKKGTSGWIAIEVLRNTGHVTNAIDVFSLGCVFYYVISNGKQMFYSDHDVQNRNPDMGQLKSDRHILIKNLIEKMINRNPKQRPSCKEIHEDIYFWDAKEVLTFIKNVEELLCSGKVEDEKQRMVEDDSTVILNANLGEKSPPPIIEDMTFNTVRELIQYISKNITKTDESMQHFDKIQLKFPKLFLHLHNLFGNYKPNSSLRPRLGSESFRKIQPHFVLHPGLSLDITTPKCRPMRRSFSLMVPPRILPKLTEPHLTCCETVNAHNECVQHVAFSNNGKMIATCSLDKTLKVWKPGSDISQYEKNMEEIDWKMVKSSQFNNDDTALLVCGMHIKKYGEVAIFSVKSDGLQQICTVKNDLVLTNAWQSDSCFLSGERNAIQDKTIHEISLNNLPKNKSSAMQSNRIWTYYTDENVKTVGIIHNANEMGSKKRGSGYDECFGYLVYNTRHTIGVKKFMLSYANFVKPPRGSASLKAKPQFDKPDMKIPLQEEICNTSVVSPQRRIYTVTKSPRDGYRIRSFELTPNDYKTILFDVPNEYKLAQGSTCLLDASINFLVSATKGSSSLFVWDRNSGKFQSKEVLDGSVEGIAINPVDETLLATSSGKQLKLWKFIDSDA